MFESGKPRLRVILKMSAVLMLSYAVSVVCQTPAAAPKSPETATSEASKPPDAKSPESQAKPKKDLDPNAEKQKQLADDTARLLQLANELKVEMDKSTKDTLSLTVMKKAEEVEKLARKVRDEMKKSIGN